MPGGDKVMAEEWRRDKHLISTDRCLVDLDVVHGFLQRSYWAADRPLETVRRSVEHSLNFGLYRDNDRLQVGFARVVTDFATFAWICDVFIDEAHRGQGLGVWLMETIAGHHRLQGLRISLLATRDAHSLYEKVGFKPLGAPERWMWKLNLWRGVPSCQSMAAGRTIVLATSVEWPSYQAGPLPKRR
jgi:GNAT superfamily N-acetyltransferase